MKESEMFAMFLAKASQDPRITIWHLGLYAIFLNWWHLQGCIGPLKVYSYQVMPVAKISCRSRYCKLIRELHEYGYLKYKSSDYSKKASLIELHVC